MRVLVLGAGFGGLELTTRLSEALGDDADVVLVDKADGFVFGFSKLDVMFGRTTADAVHHRYADVVKPGVRFVQATIESIDPVAKRVETDAGPFEADVLVVALGADLHPEATPGLVEGGHEFYTVAGAFALRDVLADFDGGRVIVGVVLDAVQVPAGAERDGAAGARLPHRARPARAVGDLAGDAAAGADPAVAGGVGGAAGRLRRARHRLAPASGSCARSTPTARSPCSPTASEMPYDLFLGVPVHRVPEVVAASGMTVDGWIPVDPLTLETSFPGVYAVGDVTSVGTPKAGVFAEGQAGVVADAIIAQARGGDAAPLRRPRASATSSSATTRWPRSTSPS